MRKIENPALAAQAAVLIAEGEPDWSAVRRKLMEENELPSASLLPSDDEIETALREHYALFDPKGHAKRLLELRKMALRVMTELEPFDPKLIRGVLNGCADQYSDIHLMVQADDAKSLEIELMDRGINIEVFPNLTESRNEPVEEIAFEAPLVKNGFFAQNHLTVWVRMKVFEGAPLLKNKQKKAPDRWQIEEETSRSADIALLQKIIRLTDPDSANFV